MGKASIFRYAKKAMGCILKEERGPGHPVLSSVPDPRKEQGKRYSWKALCKLLLCGMLGCYKSLRAVVALGQQLNLWITYTPLYNILSSLKEEIIRPVLHKQIQRLHYAKCLAPVNFPCPIAAIDGKSLYYGPYKLNKYCQKSTNTKTGKRNYNLRVTRTTLVSAGMRPTIDQQPIPAKTSEEGFFEQYFSSLIKLYGRNVLNNATFTIDAGYTSLENATLVNKAGHGYIMALKKNQPGLLDEAKRMLEEKRRGPAEFVSEWRPYQGKEYRYTKSC